MILELSGKVKISKFSVQLCDFITQQRELEKTYSKKIMNIKLCKINIKNQNRI